MNVGVPTSGAGDNIGAFFRKFSPYRVVSTAEHVDQGPLRSCTHVCSVFMLRSQPTESSVSTDTCTHMGECPHTCSTVCQLRGQEALEARQFARDGKYPCGPLPKPVTHANHENFRRIRSQGCCDQFPEMSRS